MCESAPYPLGVDSTSPSSTGRRLTERLLLVLGLLGAVLLIDGALRGELRHRLVGMGLGTLLLFPLGTRVVLGVRTLRHWTRLLLSSAVLLVGLLVVEFAVRVFDVRAISVPELMPDPALGHVRRPNRGGMDAWGFRNESVPDRADVVCIGDSQTYGANIRAMDTWPRALARHTGLVVYNLSQGGYGPLQHLALTERALELSPRVVVVAFYQGNDLVDAHRVAGLEHWESMRDPTLAYSVPGDVPGYDLRSLNLAMGLVDGLTARSRLLGCLVQHLKLQFKVNPALAGLFRDANPPESFEDARVPTFFNPDYRLQTIDLRQPDVRDGLRITGLCLEGMQAACRERGVELVMLYLPNKEVAYGRWLAQRGEQRSERMRVLGEAGRGTADAVLALAGELGLRVIDTTPALIAALDEGIACWPPNSDDHFSPQGCERIAALLSREL